MATATARERASSRNVRAGVYLLDPEDRELYEVLGTRSKTVNAGVVVITEVKLGKVSDPVLYDLREELRRGAWCPFEEVVEFEVVRPLG